MDVIHIVPEEVHSVSTLVRLGRRDVYMVGLVLNTEDGPFIVHIDPLVAVRLAEQITRLAGTEIPIVA
jgi:hypothetical protein